MELVPKYVKWHKDAQFTAQFDEALKTSGAEVKRNTQLSPHLRAHVERFIQTLKVECLDRFVIVAERHLNCVNRKCRLYYIRERPHEGCGHLPPECEKPPEPAASIQTRDVVCTTRLGGLPKAYSRRAA